MTTKGNLEFRFTSPACSSIEFTSDYFPWFQKNVVILCFDKFDPKKCYSFDGKLTYIGDSYYEHSYGGLTKYKTNLLSVGGCYLKGGPFGGPFDGNQKTEILKIRENKNNSLSIISQFVEHDFEFTRAKRIFCHSLVTVGSYDINEEYVLLIGGYNDRDEKLENIFKFNGTWVHFGRLNKPRVDHNSIYWNGAVYVIGGYLKTKMEIWNIKDSPDEFKTNENWPELLHWELPHLFIVPDSFFPDH